MLFQAEPVTSHSVIIHVGKTLDFSNAEVFSHLCSETLTQGYHYFILDFSKTGILDSSGLGAIFKLQRQIPAEGKVVFADLSEAVRVVVQITNIYRVFTMFPTTEAACRTMNKYAEA